MKCTEFQKRISLFIDGELREPLTRDIEEHLAACPECRAFRATAEKVTRSLRESQLISPRPALAARVGQRIREEREAREDRGLVPTWSRVPALALVVLLAVGLGNLAGGSVIPLILADRSDAGFEYLMPDQEPSFDDVVLDLGIEENSR
jgi:predicted anti-sigma-YlaC factor YlaD